MSQRNPRQIRYNKETISGAQEQWRFQNTFFILNTESQIRIIREKILGALGQCDELEELESGLLIPKGSLHGKLVTVKSNTAEIRDRRRVYNTEAWRYDRTLRSMNDVDFATYCEQFHQK
ncbi:hypothetical protein HN935_03710 [archaeon]|jgi:hypothetical protein|nr:hypothetical protein [archaeon]